jgi:protein-L-isoaspartate(D-aspartate) O-methyltransferase
MTIDECRRFYSDEIRFAGNVHSPALVAAFGRVPREKFLGPGPWEIASAEVRGMAVAGGIQTSYVTVDDPRDLYHNVVVVLDKAGDINNGQPSALARWIDAMDLKTGDRAYHLGCGVGYYTAIMAEVVGPSGSVVGAEVNESLAAHARDNLAAYSNVQVASADGTTFDPGVCDAMLINAGVTHPSALWLDRMRDGGRLVLPLTIATTPKIGVGMMMKIVRLQTKFSVEIVSSLAIYSCAGMRDAALEPKLKVAMANGSLLKVKSLRRDPHEPTPACVLHSEKTCFSSDAIPQ